MSLASLNKRLVELENMQDPDEWIYALSQTDFYTHIFETMTPAGQDRVLDLDFQFHDKVTEKAFFWYANEMLFGQQRRWRLGPISLPDKVLEFFINHPDARIHFHSCELCGYHVPIAKDDHVYWPDHKWSFVDPEPPAPADRMTLCPLCGGRVSPFGYKQKHGVFAETKFVVAGDFPCQKA